MYLTISDDQSVILNADDLYKLLKEAISCKFIKAAESLTGEYNSEKIFKIGNVLFGFYGVGTPDHAANMYIKIENENTHLELFNSLTGWNYTEDEISQRTKIIKFLATIYNKVSKQREILKQKQLHNKTVKREKKIELLKHIKIKGLF